MEITTMWGGVLEPELEEDGIGLVVTAAKQPAVDNPKEDPEDDPGEDPLAADEELEELDEDELEGDGDEDEDYPEVDDDLIDLDDEWDDQEEEERHDNPHKFYE